MGDEDLPSKKNPEPIKKIRQKNCLDSEPKTNNFLIKEKTEKSENPLEKKNPTRMDTSETEKGKTIKNKWKDPKRPGKKKKKKKKKKRRNQKGQGKKKKKKKKKK